MEILIDIINSEDCRTHTIKALKLTKGFIWRRRPRVEYMIQIIEQRPKIIMFQ